MLSYITQIIWMGIVSSFMEFHETTGMLFYMYDTSHGEGNGNPLLENPMDRGAWWATYSPRGGKEVDTTEWRHFHFRHFRIVAV